MMYKTAEPTEPCAEPVCCKTPYPQFRPSRLIAAWLCVLFVVMAGRNGTADAANSALPPPPGRLVDIGGQRLHLICQGEPGPGRPTVILEAGLGGTALEWVRVQRQLGSVARVCSYDRAGMGWSDASRGARTSAVVAKELYQLLRSAAEPGPYLLVGHSLGGYSVQLFARYYPDDVAGLVLVDASHPQQIDRFAAPPVRVNIAPRGRLLFLMPVSVPDNMPAEVRGQAGRLLTHNARIATTRELQGFRLSAQQLAQATALPEVPLVVITRGVQKWPQDERGNRMEALWQQLQAELARASRLGAQVIARRSGHHVHLDQPDLVSDVIRSVIAASVHVRGGRAQQAALSEALSGTAERFAAVATIDQRDLRQGLFAAEL